MKLNDYIELAKLTRAKLDSHNLDVTHMLLGISNEAGELAGAYKKHLAYGTELDKVNVEEEIGDLMWFIVNLCDVEGFDLESIFNQNIEKLSVRHGDKFNAYRASNRNLELEREVLTENSATFTGRLSEIK